MKPHQLVLWLLAMFSTTFIACRKPAIETPAPPSNTKSLLLQMQKGSNITRFDYNAAGDLVTITDSVSNNRNVFKTRLEYESNRLAKGTYGNVNYALAYPDVNTVVVETGSQSNPVLDREVYAYNGDRLLNYTKHHYQSNTEWVPELRSNYSYDAAGNVVREEEEGYDMYEGKWVPIRTVTTTYDNKPNTFFAVETRQLAHLGKKVQVIKNNPVLREFRNKSGNLYRTEKFQYEYDAAGRKTKQFEEVWAGNRLLSKDTTVYSYR